jgi:hypothetical protein
VAAQLVVAFSVVDYLDDDNMREGEAERYRRLMRRIVLSALPVVATAAGVDLKDLDADYLLGFSDREFQPVTMEQPDRMRW